MRKLIFIGDSFYSESGSWMSSLYEEGTWKRWDWGFVQVDCKEGRTVNIRPATEEELNIANQMLTKMKAKQDKPEVQ